MRGTLRGLLHAALAVPVLLLLVLAAFTEPLTPEDEWDVHKHL